MQGGQDLHRRGRGDRRSRRNSAGPSSHPFNLRQTSRPRKEIRKEDRGQLSKR